MSPVKIVITGPESTGKSTLSAELARQYNTGWVKEYAREYIEQLDRSYTENDLPEIAKGQIHLEENQTKKSSKIIICDTDLITIKIWSDYKYGSTDPWILQKINEQTDRHYLLADIDLPWKEDPQREHPDKRSYFLEVFKKELEAYNKPYDVISGSGGERLKRAIEIIEGLIP